MPGVVHLSECGGSGPAFRDAWSTTTWSTEPGAFLGADEVLVRREPWGQPWAIVQIDVTYVWFRNWEK